MTTATEPAALSPTEAYGNQIIRESGRVVTRSGQEVEFFHNEKDAGAWIQHVYGVTPWAARPLGIHIEPIRDREPRPGDYAVYGGSDPYYMASGKGKTGILETICGDLVVCLDPSAFRDGPHVSCSGGPLPFLDPGDLMFVGLHRAHFWRWGNGNPGAHMGGHYQMTVPMWRWDRPAPIGS